MFKQARTSLVWLFLFSMVVFSLISVTSCTDTKVVTEVVYDTTTEYATFVCILSMRFSEGILFSDPLADPGQSQVKIKWNGDERLFPEETMYPNYIFFTDTTDLSVQKEYIVELTSDVGTCYGQITIPSANSIIQPKHMDTLSRYGNVYCEWSTTTEADFYYLYYAAYGYDSQGFYVGFCGGKQEFLSSNSYTIPGSYFDKIPGVAYYEVDLSVDPCAGVDPEPGASGNMSGNVGGFLTASGEGDYIWFYVGTPTSSPSSPVKKPIVRNHTRTYIKTLGIDVETK